MFKFLPGRYNATLRRLWKFTRWGAIGTVGYLLAVYFNLLGLFGRMPSLQQLDNPRSELASELIASDGPVLGSYFIENRSPVELEEVSPKLINALIATEDVRFVRHAGIDPRGLARSISSLGRAGGGSTLTQQLVKNLFNARGEEYSGFLHKIPGVRMLIIKTKEWITSVQIERRYTKHEIMQMYLNTVDFSDNAAGIRTASLRYFSKEPANLNLAESATLVGMCQNPTRFNPRMHPVASKDRRNIVLSQMVKYGFINKEQYDNIKEQPVQLKLRSVNHNTNKAPYFVAAMRDQLLKEIEQINRERASTEPLNLYTSGLRIYTTVDSRMQQHAQDAALEHIKEQQRLFDSHWKGKNPWIDEDGKEYPGFLKERARYTERWRTLKESYGNDEEKIWAGMRKPAKMRIFSYKGERDTVMTPMDSIQYYKRFLHIGMMAMDPNSGHVKAWVGGVNFKYFKYDHVRQAKRQPGSSFKPFVYATAIDEGFTPCDRFTDRKTCIGDWCPQNFEGSVSGRSLSLRQAIAKSVNTISVQLMQKFGPEKISEYAHRLGIKSKIPEKDVTICLGTPDVSLFEMVNAYSTFVNAGVAWDDPVVILRIEDRYGNVLKKYEPTTHDAISPETAWKMVYMLQGATQEPGGTSQRLNREPCGKNNQIGGKTGTTSSFSDAWFMGVTQGLVAGVWVGCDEPKIRTFRSGGLGQGARLALPAWAKFMNRVYDDTSIGLEKIPFKKPENDKVCADPFGGSRVGGDTTLVIPGNEAPPEDPDLQ